MNSIYFARAAELVKIGETGNCERRIKEIQATSPAKVELIGSWFALHARDLEREMHARFAAHRRHGEWFAIPETDLAKICAELDTRCMTGNGKICKPELKLIGETELLETIWPDPKTRPSHRTLTAWRLAGRIPFVRIGGNDYRKGTRRGNSGQVWYELDDVAKAIAEKWTVQRKGRVAK